MSTEQTFRGLNDLFDLAKEAAVPLIVRRRCTPHQLAVWLALRTLLELRPKAALGLRDIGQEANLTATTRISGWIDDLVALGFLAVVGHEDVPNMAHPRTVYRIPWKELHEANSAEVERYLIQLGIGRPRPTPPDPDQLPIPLPPPAGDDPLEDAPPVIDRSQGEGGCDRSITEPCDRSITGAGGGVIDRSQSPVIDRSQGHIEGTHGRARAVSQSVSQSEGERSALAEPPDQPGPDPDPPLPPPPPPGERALGQHPLVLLATLGERADAGAPTWALLAAEHDGPTAGHGWYWVGRAIEAGLVSQGGIEQIRNPFNLTRSILTAWRAHASYGAPPRASAPRQRPSAGRAVGAPPAAVPPGTRPSTLPIISAGWVPHDKRSAYEGRFRAAAGDPERQRRIVEEFFAEFPPPAAAD